MQIHAKLLSDSFCFPAVLHIQRNTNLLSCFLKIPIHKPVGNTERKSTEAGGDSPTSFPILVSQCLPKGGSRRCSQWVKGLLLIWSAECHGAKQDTKDIKIAGWAYAWNKVVRVILSQVLMKKKTLGLTVWLFSPGFFFATHLIKTMCSSTIFLFVNK